MAPGAKSTREKFLVELIKPSHYDDDGYVIQLVARFRPVKFAVVYLWARDGCARSPRPRR